MVKFSKELEAQLIPEWKDAFVNYWQLKKSVKTIKLLIQSTAFNETENEDVALVADPSVNIIIEGFSIFDPIRSLCSRLSSRFCRRQQTGDLIQVRGGDDENLYQTELVESSAMDVEIKEFFDLLDEELNKVNGFFRLREKEFLERGESLKKQLQILLDLKRIIQERRRKSFLSEKDESGTLFDRSGSLPSSPYRSSDRSDCPTETDEPMSDSVTDDLVATLEKNGMVLVGCSPRSKSSKFTIKGGKLRSTSMRIDIPATTPSRALSAMTSMLWEDVINGSKKENCGDTISRKKIQCAEKMIKGAYVELYRGLGLLKTYSSLNLVAFSKILKKFDKVSSRQASSTYLAAVKRSYFASSDKVVRLADEVESIFTENFASNDKKRAMKFLRPQHKKDSHMITFLVGLFTGCMVALFTIYAILAQLSGMFTPSSPAGTGYMNIVYPVFSMFALFSLHLFLYGCNICTWRSTRINYKFIFEFSPTNSLKHIDAFFLGTFFMTMLVVAMLCHLIFRANDLFPDVVDAIPSILLLVSLMILVCPFNVFYRSTRYYFIRVMRNIVCSPFYKVVMVDFFMADQLTSQVPLLRHLEFATCYFLAGTFKSHDYQTCSTGKLYRELAYVISFSPYYFRAMQCARRWFDEGDLNHLANLGKYVSAMIAAGARLTYSIQPTPFWLVIVVITSTIATMYQLYWDFIKDWGLLNPRSKNPWLRDDLILKQKWVYYASLALNFGLRITWIEALMTLNGDHRMKDFALAALEVIRRGHWNFYRLENEHLNNVGKFRAVKAVPLPFRELDIED